MDAPKVNQCCLCQEWHLESNLSPVKIPNPDRGNRYVKKLACKKCLTIIMEEEGAE